MKWASVNWIDRKRIEVYKPNWNLWKDDISFIGKWKLGCWCLKLKQRNETSLRNILSRKVKFFRVSVTNVRLTLNVWGRKQRLEKENWWNKESLINEA